MDIKQCRTCGEAVDDRPNKLFCSAKCKSRYHNIKAWKKREKQRKKMAIIGYTLKKHWKNRKILSKLIPSDTNTTEVSQKVLNKAGFDFFCVTGFEDIEDQDQSLFFVYDYSFVFIDLQNIKITYHG